MRAILLAAGEGRRLRPYTDDRPKGLVELGGRPLLEHQLAALQRAGIHDVHLVTGYRAEALEALGCPRLHNPRWAETEMVASLMCAAALLDGGDDALVAYADIVYEDRVLASLLGTQAPLATAVDRDWLRLWRLRSPEPLADAETLRLSPSGDILELGRRPRSLAEIEGQYLGLTLVRARAAPELVRLHRELDPRADYDGHGKDRMPMTSLLQAWIDSGRALRAAPVRGGWLEVDTAADLRLYRRLQREGRLDAFCRLGDRGGAAAQGAAR